MAQFIVRPISRDTAQDLCSKHPHAPSVPNSSKYYFRLEIDGKVAGLAIWGWGVVPAVTPSSLFKRGTITTKEYLELCRFFVFDWCEKNTASKFLATTHRLIKKHLPHVKFLFTYAAGFQGLVGYIYQASGYDYIGPVETRDLYVPNVGLVHPLSLYHRYGSSSTNPKRLAKIFPNCKQWGGYNFRYIYWLCDKETKSRLMSAANFEVIRPYPKEKDIRIWLEDKKSPRVPLDPKFAKTIPIVKLKSSRRAASIDVDAPGFQPGEGGSIPTAALQK